MREYSRSKPRKMSAGRVKMTPEAIDWPALPVVWTMLFSRMEALAEGAQDADGEDGDGDGGGDGEAGAQADIDRDGAEDDAEDGAEQEGAKGELGSLVVRRDIGREDGEFGFGSDDFGHGLCLRRSYDEYTGLSGTSKKQIRNGA